MSVLILILALALLMTVAYRGYSVIVGAPVCAMLAVLLAVGPQALLPTFSDLFMAATVSFVQNYLPVFLLGALFGKAMELTGAAASISEHSTPPMTHAFQRALSSSESGIRSGSTSP